MTIVFFCIGMLISLVLGKASVGVWRMCRIEEEAHAINGRR